MDHTEVRKPNTQNPLHQRRRDHTAAACGHRTDGR